MGFLEVYLMLSEASCVRMCSALWKQRDEKSSLKSCIMFQVNTGFWRKIWEIRHPLSIDCQWDIDAHSSLEILSLHTTCDPRKPGLELLSPFDAWLKRYFNLQYGSPSKLVVLRKVLKTASRGWKRIKS